MAAVLSAKIDVDQARMPLLAARLQALRQWLARTREAHASGQSTQASLSTIQMPRGVHPGSTVGAPALGEPVSAQLGRSGPGQVAWLHPMDMAADVRAISGLPADRRGMLAARLQQVSTVWGADAEEAAQALVWTISEHCVAQLAASTPARAPAADPAVPSATAGAGVEPGATAAGAPAKPGALPSNSLAKLMSAPVREAKEPGTSSVQHQARLPGGASVADVVLALAQRSTSVLCDQHRMMCVEEGAIVRVPGSGVDDSSDDGLCIRGRAAGAADVALALGGAVYAGLPSRALLCWQPAMPTHARYSQLPAPAVPIAFSGADSEVLKAVVHSHARVSTLAALVRYSAAARAPAEAATAAANMPGAQPPQAKHADDGSGALSALLRSWLDGLAATVAAARDEEAELRASRLAVETEQSKAAVEASAMPLPALQQAARGAELAAQSAAAGHVGPSATESASGVALRSASADADRVAKTLLHGAQSAAEAHIRMLQARRDELRRQIAASKAQAESLHAARESMVNDFQRLRAAVAASKSGTDAQVAQARAALQAAAAAAGMTLDADGQPRPGSKPAMLEDAAADARSGAAARGAARMAAVMPAIAADTERRIAALRAERAVQIEQLQSDQARAVTADMQHALQAVGQSTDRAHARARELEAALINARAQTAALRRTVVGVHSQAAAASAEQALQAARAMLTTSSSGHSTSEEQQLLTLLKRQVRASWAIGGRIHSAHPAMSTRAKREFLQRALWDAPWSASTHAALREHATWLSSQAHTLGVLPSTARAVSDLREAGPGAAPSPTRRLGSGRLGRPAANDAPAKAGTPSGTADIAATARAVAKRIRASVVSKWAGVPSASPGTSHERKQNEAGDDLVFSGVNPMARGLLGGGAALQAVQDDGSFEGSNPMAGRALREH